MKRLLCPLLIALFSVSLASAQDDAKDSDAAAQAKAAAKLGPQRMIRHYLRNNELELSDEQVSSLKDLAEETFPKYAATSGSDVNPDNKAELQRLKNERAAIKAGFLEAVADILTDEQEATLKRQAEEKANSPEALAKAEARRQEVYGPNGLVRDYFRNSALDLTNEQKTALTELAADTFPRYQATSTTDVDPKDVKKRDELKNERIAIKREFLEKVNEILTTEQIETLAKQAEERRNSPQAIAKAEAKRKAVYGPTSLARPYLRSRILDLTDDQRAALTELSEETFPAFQATDRSNAEPDDIEKRAELKLERVKVLVEFQAGVEEILTEEQLADWKKQKEEEAALKAARRKAAEEAAEDESDSTDRTE